MNSVIANITYNEQNFLSQMTIYEINFNNEQIWSVPITSF